MLCSWKSLCRSLLVVVSCGTAHVTDSARAYSIHGGWSQAQLGQSLHLTYSYSNLLDGGLLDPQGAPIPRSVLRSSIEEALSVWARYAPVHFREVPDGYPIEVPSNASVGGTIRIGHRSIDGSGNIKARAYFPGFLPITGDIHFDNTDRWNLVGSLIYPDVLGAAIHELGHALGLGHTSIAEAAMYPTFPRLSGPGTGRLHADDIAGIQALYGAGVGSVSPLPLAEPSTLLIAASALFLAAGRTLRTYRYSSRIG